MIDKFIEDVYRVVSNHPELDLYDYQDILRKNKIEISTQSLTEANISNLDIQCTLALIVAVVRMDRFSEGALLKFLKSGCMLRWLEHLKAVDK